jgi:fructosamine-3-kinase
VTGFVKRNPHAPQGFFACEAAGLEWLATARGARCVPVIEWDATSLTLERLTTAPPSRRAAAEFGAALAATHDAGAAGFGAGPDGWDGPGFFGPLHHPLPMSLTAHPTWGEFYADERLGPMAERATARLTSRGRHDVAAVLELCRAGRFDDGDAPARLHGDLWSGNLMWTKDGVVLIDPAAHGGHRETDLAMLALFGCPHFDAVVAGYQSVRPLRNGWRERVALHQLYPLLAHVVLFGGGYAGQTESALRGVLSGAGQ